MSQNNDSKPPRDLVRPHIADGIREYDNPLPRWWIGFLYASIAFSVVYLLAYHVLGWSSLEDSYAAARQQEQASSSSASASAASAGDVTARLQDPAAIAAGKEVYTTYCLPCHGANGEGSIGPNLTDDYWLHGNTPQAIIATITTGVADKGMPAWGPVLGDKKVEQTTAFVLSLHGTNPANPKAPQGDLTK